MIHGISNAVVCIFGRPLIHCCSFIFVKDDTFIILSDCYTVYPSPQKKIHQSDTEIEQDKAQKTLYRYKI